MPHPVEWMIALRYLRVRGSGWVSVLTFFSVAGVALGVMTLITVLAVMNGFRDEVRTRIIGTNAHLLLLRHDRQPVTDVEALRLGVEDNPEVVAAAPFIYGKGMVSRAGEADGAVLRGIDPAAEREVTRVWDYVRPRDVSLEIVEGELPPAIVGKELALSLRSVPGDTILVTTISASGSGAFGFVPRSEACRVAGIFDSGMYDFDASLVILPLPVARRVLGIPRGASGVSVRLRDLYRARAVGDSLVATLGLGSLSAVDWMELNPNLFSWMELEKAVMFLLLGLIVLVAAFNIASTLIMVVLEKTRDIGILKAMGAHPGRIARIFLVQGLLIGLGGTLLGTAGGLGLCTLVGRYRIISLPPEVYFIDTLPVRLELGDILVTTGVAVLISFLVTIYPCRRAASLPPVDAIRYE